MSKIDSLPNTSLPSWMNAAPFAFTVLQLISPVIASWILLSLLLLPPPLSNLSLDRLSLADLLDELDHPSVLPSGRNQTPDSSGVPKPSERQAPSLTLLSRFFLPKWLTHSFDFLIIFSLWGSIKNFFRSTPFLLSAVANVFSLCIQESDLRNVTDFRGPNWLGALN